MANTTFTLQAINEDKGLHLSIKVSTDVYLRMLRYLGEHQCRFKIISTNEYIAKDEKEAENISSNITVQFESSNLYHNMVSELASFEKRHTPQ